jgi:hypothetical protein
MAEILEIPITLTFAAAPNVFQLRSIAGAERLGTPHEYQLDLVSRG